MRREEEESFSPGDETETDVDDFQYIIQSIVNLDNFVFLQVGYKC